MKLFTKASVKILAAASLFLLAGCPHNTPENGINPDDNNQTEQTDSTKSDDKTQGTPSEEEGEKDAGEQLSGVKIQEPEILGESELPDLSKTTALSGQAYLSDDEDDVIIFNKDGTCIIKSTIGESGYSSGEPPYSFRQFEKEAYCSYSYDPSTKKLILKLKGLFTGDVVVSNADDYVKNALKLLKQSVAAQGYTTVAIPQEWIDEKKKQYAQNFSQNNTKEYICSISENGKLMLENLSSDNGYYKYDEGDIKIKLYLNSKELYIENGSSELNMPIIFFMEEGKFSGADYKWTYQGKAAILEKIGDFEGTYVEDYGELKFNLTSVGWNFPSAIYNMKGNTYYLKPNRSKEIKEEFNPILKTINYTVIGFDNVIATENLQAYISDPTKTKWNADTFTLLTSGYITGIYTNKECERSVITNELDIIDGGRVFVKLKNIKAVNYNNRMGNLMEGIGDSCEVITQKACSITFDANDGSNKTKTENFTAGIPFYFSDSFIRNEVGQEKNGYYFVGWAKESNATEKEFDASAYHTFSDDVILYAVWKKVYTVTVKDPDGICEDTVRKNTDGEYSSEYVYLSTRNFSKEGYTIVGYSKNKNATEPEYELYRISLEEFGDSTELTVYVVWRKTYSVSFIIDGETKDIATVTKGLTVSNRGSYWKNGYDKIDGWYTDVECTKKFNFASAILEDTYLYAKYIPNSYTIIFDVNGGISTGEEQTQEFKYDEEKKLLVNSYTPPENGLKFSHWSTSSSDSSYGKTYTDEEVVKNLSSTNNGEIRLYAIWKYNTTYNFHDIITVLPAGTEGSGGTTATYVYFGDFPQTRKANGVISEGIYSETIRVGDNLYYSGNDGNWYAYESGSKYYKVEPIKWRVLTDNYNETGYALLMAENIITSTYFYFYSVDREIENKTISPSNYEYSNIRAYLNGLSYITKSSENDSLYNDTWYIDKGFLQTAFSTDAQDLIKAVTIDNSTTAVDEKLHKDNDYSCADTEDKVFLLNTEELSNIEYGFEEIKEYDKCTYRVRKTTDFAKENIYNNYDYYITRSPNCYVLNEGGIYYWNDYWRQQKLGVVPAICVDLTE